MATSRPKAVVTSASAMPAETDPRPPDPVAAMAWKAVMMPATVPSSPTKGAVEPTVASAPRPRRRSAAVRQRRQAPLVLLDGQAEHLGEVAPGELVGELRRLGELAGGEQVAQLL